MPSTEAGLYHGDCFKPLEDAKKKDSHYRAIKTRILRSLGTATYRNGCQFAILWVSPSGEVSDAFASEALQPKLDGWFSDGIQQGARETVRAWNADKERRSNLGEEATGNAGVYGAQGLMISSGQIDEDMSDGEASHHRQGSNRSERTFSPKRIGSSGPARPQLGDSNVSFASSTSSTSSLPPNHPLNPVPLPPTASAITSPSLSSKNVKSPILDSSSIPSKPQISYDFTPEQLERWFTERLGELNHKADKMICRSWIKVIEPQKQTNYPYQKGEETRPGWWPKGVRHKDPDHLAKYERIALLLHLLRLPSVSIDHLECATSTIALQIPREKQAILHAIYECAKAERKAITTSYTGSFDKLSVMLSPPPTAAPIQEEEEEESPIVPSPVFSAVPSPLLPAEPRTARGTRARSRNSVDSPNAADFAVSQQTPRSSRAAPYPLARSASASTELANLSLSSATSPSLGHSPASTSLSRSQSFVGNNSNPRTTRLTGRSSIGEADLQATPYQGGRVRSSITPRQMASQGSPLSSSMGRSASTSAIGAKTMMDDSVASPAMIKSRSKLSQRCFEQMGAMNAGGGGGDEANVRQTGGLPAQPEFGQIPQHQLHMVHPHHFQTARPYPEGFPPPPPLPPTASRSNSHPHNPLPTQMHYGVQQIVPNPPHLVRQSSSQHLSNRAQQHPNLQHARPQVQVQVQVHAGHELPPHFEQPQNVVYQGYSHSPVPVQSQFAHGSQHQHPMHYNSANGGFYEHSSAMQPHQLAAHEAYLVSQSANGTPSLSTYITSPEIPQHSNVTQEYFAQPHQNGIESFDPNYYLASSHQSTGEPDLGAYVQQLEVYERRQAQQEMGNQEIGLGFESYPQNEVSPFGGHEGYYDESPGHQQDYSMSTSMDPSQLRNDVSRRRYEGMVG